MASKYITGAQVAGYGKRQVAGMQQHLTKTAKMGYPGLIGMKKAPKAFKLQSKLKKKGLQTNYSR